MAEFASLPLFTDAWLADTGHLTFAEQGLYMRLLILCWRSPECRIPNDENWIARQVRAHDSEREMLHQIVLEFMTSDGNFLTQKRLRKEFLYTRKKSKANSASAKSRWKKEKDACDRIYEDDAESMRYLDSSHSVRNAPTPTPTPTLIEPPLTSFGEVQEGFPDSALGSGAEAEPPPAEPNEPKPKRASRLPDDWQPSEADTAFATAEGFTQAEVLRQGDRFRDYWRSTGTPKKDWPATWRNWIRREADQRKIIRQQKPPGASGYYDERGEWRDGRV